MIKFFYKNITWLKGNFAFAYWMIFCAWQVVSQIKLTIFFHRTFSGFHMEKWPPDIPSLALLFIMPENIVYYFPARIVFICFLLFWLLILLISLLYRLGYSSAKYIIFICSIIGAIYYSLLSTYTYWMKFFLDAPLVTVGGMEESRSTFLLSLENMSYGLLFSFLNIISLTFIVINWRHSNERGGMSGVSSPE